MVDYRKTIYENYHSNQVNKSDSNHKQLLEQQSFYYARELVPFLPKNKAVSIVDVGCGFGSFVHAAKRSGYHTVKGIDLSKEQVEVAHELGIHEVLLQSIDEYFAGDNTAECIVGIDIIEHLTKDELVVFLQNCYTHLPKGGVVLFRTPNMDAALASVYAFADISHETFLNKSSSIQLLRSIGFSDVEVYPSMIFNRNPVKELIRKCIWGINLCCLKLTLFASGRTWNDVVFTPNLIVRAVKH